MKVETLKDGDKYYFISSHMEIGLSIFEKGVQGDIEVLDSCNWFRTEEEAIKARDIILEKLKELKEE